MLPARRRRFSGPPSTGPTLVYAVGDIHGRNDLLVAMVKAIYSDISKYHYSIKPRLIFLGDYIDRGPCSREVIETMIRIGRLAAAEVICLKGNHEAALLNFLDNPIAGERWLDWGGADTLASYGVSLSLPDDDDADGLVELAEALRTAMPLAHLSFLASLKLRTQVGDFAFVHAGVRPENAIDDQQEADILWIRNDFLRDQQPLEKMIVHGHTISDAPYWDHRRIGVDTGAFKTGTLSAVRLHGNSVKFLQVGDADSPITLQQSIAPKRRLSYEEREGRVAAVNPTRRQPPTRAPR